MKSLWLIPALALLLACGFTEARASEYSRTVGETDMAFAQRVLRIPDSGDPNVIAADWNGVPTLFVDYETTGDNPDRLLVALQRQPDGAYRAIQVTDGEQEGGTPDIAAIGFANADRDPAKELIVILTWNQAHYDVGGTLYEVRLFDDPKPGQISLTQLKLSGHFGSECDCTWRDGSSKHYPFKTIAAVKAELKRLGY